MASQGKGTSKGKQTGTRKKKTTTRRPIVLVAVILVSIIMVGSILLPSLSSIISGMQNTESEASATTSAQTDATSSTTTAANTVLDNLNTRYQSQVDALEKKNSENAGDAATLINLANAYYTWGTQAKSYATTDDENSQVTDHFQKAMGYYDQYLATNDASSARVARAMCQYYTGDKDGAKAALEAFTQTVTDFAPAWYNLGIIYEDAGDTQAATDAYNKALSADPTGSYGLSSTISSKLSSLSASTTDAATTDAAATTEAATTDGGSN